MILQFLMSLLNKFWTQKRPIPPDESFIPQPPEPPKPPVEPGIQPVEPVSRISVWAAGIKEFEGWIVPGGTDATGKVYPKGSSSYRCKNPGNLEDTHGNKIVYSTYEVGLAALENYLERAATGKHAAYPHGATTTLSQFTHIYTGDPEPSPTNYAHFLANKLGVGIDTKIGELV